MPSFDVVIICLHLATCPLKGGQVFSQLHAETRELCERIVKVIIKGDHLNPDDYSITCTIRDSI